MANVKPQTQRRGIRTTAPWGYFQVIDEGKGYKAKRIVVEPGARLSLQKHTHRAEHWVVVDGIADVTIGSETSRLDENRSAFIARGEIHRLANPGDRQLTTTTSAHSPGEAESIPGGDAVALS